MPHRLLTFALLAVALVAIAPPGLRAEEGDEDGTLVARFFEVGALTRGRIDFIPENLRLVSPWEVSDEENPLFGAEGEEPFLPVGDLADLATLIRQNVDPVTWQITDGAEILGVGEDLLLIQATRGVMDEVARYLAELEATVLTTVTVEVRAVTDAPAGATVEELLETGTQGPTVVLTALAGQQATALAGRQISFLQDYDVEVAQDSSISDPIVGVANTGLGVAVRSVVSDGLDRIRVRLRATLVTSDGMRTHTTEARRTIELPEQEIVEVRSNLLLRPGRWQVAEGSTGGADRPVFLVRAVPSRTLSPVGRSPSLYEPNVRADTGPLVTRTYDVADLDYAEHHTFDEPNLVPSNFTPPEPPEMPEALPVFPGSSLPDLMPLLVSPGSWNREGTGIREWNGRLVVTNTAKVLERVEAALAALRGQFLWTVATEVEIVEVPGGVADALLNGTEGGYLLAARGRQVLEAALASGEAERLDGVRVGSLGGVRNAVKSGREVSYVQDFEVELAEKSNLSNPVIQILFEGVVADVHPAVTTTDDAVDLSLRVTRTVLDEPMRGVVTPHGEVEMPAIDVVRIRTNVRVPLGATAIVAAGGDDERATLVLATPRRTTP